MASDEKPRKIPRKPWEPFRGLKITPPPEEESSDPEIREYQNQRYRHDFEGGPEPKVMPRRPVRVESPFMGRTYELGSVPYNIAPAANMAAQAIYGQKTLPLYFNPYTAPFARAVDAYETAKRIKENPQNWMNYLGVPGAVMGANKLGAAAVGAGAIGGTQMQEQAQAPESPPARSRIMGDERISNANRLAASLTSPEQFSKLISHGGSEALPMRLPYGQRYNQQTGELNSPQSKDIGFQGPIRNAGHDVTEYSVDRGGMQYPSIYQGMSDEDRGSVLAAERFGQDVPEAVDQRAYEAAKGRVEQGHSPFYEPGNDPYPAWSPDQHWEEPVISKAFGGAAYAANVGEIPMSRGGNVNFKLDKNPKWRMSLNRGGGHDEYSSDNIDMTSRAKGGRAIDDALRLARDHMRRGGHPRSNFRGPAFAPHFGSDREAMIRTMLAEARGEGLKGMEAVGYNLRNRADANYGNYGSSIASQALGRRPGSKYGEYSSWNPYGKPSNAGKSALKIPESSAIYKQAAAAADTVLGRMEQDPTMGSSNYRNSAASSKKSDAWFNKLQDKIDIGNHTFGRAPGFHVPVDQFRPKIGDTAMLQGAGPTPQAMQMAGLQGGAGAKMSLPEGMQGAPPQKMMAQAAPAAPTPPHQEGPSGQQIVSSPLARINPADPSGPPAPAKLPDVDVGRASPPPMQMASAAPAAQPNEPASTAHKMEMPGAPPEASAPATVQESASAQGDGPAAPEAPQMQQDIFGQPFEPPEFLQGLQHMFARGGSVDHALKIAHEAMKKGGGAWTRKEGKSESGGLNEKGRASLRAQGHDIKRPQPEGGPRRDSFCARSAGQMKMFPEAAKDPNSRLRKARRKWNCADGGAIDDALRLATGGEVWDKPRPKKLGKPKELSSSQKASAKASAKAAGRPYPNFVDNVNAAKKK